MYFSINQRAVEHGQYGTMRADLINRGDTYIDVKENYYLFLTYLIVSR